jgi:hypothetical protein
MSEFKIFNSSNPLTGEERLENFLQDKTRLTQILEANDYFKYLNKSIQDNKIIWEIVTKLLCGNRSYLSLYRLARTNSRAKQNSGGRSVFFPEAHQ